MRDKVTQADIDAAKLYLQGAGPWKLDEIGIAEDDYLVKCFARHRAQVVAECLQIIDEAAPSIYDMGHQYIRVDVIEQAIRALAN